MFLCTKWFYASKGPSRRGGAYFLHEHTRTNDGPALAVFGGVLSILDGLPLIW